MAVNGSILTIINNPYQPERRRREGQLHTPHDPILALIVNMTAYDIPGSFYADDDEMIGPVWS